MAEEIPVSTYTADELLQIERFATMPRADLARIAWTYERKAYMFGIAEMNSETPDFDWCSRYEALKASRLYEAAERVK